ncbi:MAG TPA: sigma-70 family RNA polymerase sigma factor [Polyangia bacterium]
MSELSPSDEVLLAGARAGDRRALEALLERHEAQVYRFGMAMCRDPEDAKDVLQDTLLAMARTVRDFRGASSLSTWLYTIARSFCIKKRRRSKLAPEEERSLETGAAREAGRLVDPADAPEEALAGKEVERALARAIGELEPMYREVLLLRDVEGLTAAEVGEITGITTQAVKSRLHRARLAVRERVAPLLGIETDRPAAPGTCPDVLTMFSQHLEDEIDADLCARMERHLESCGRCRGACDTFKQTLAMCRTAGTSAPVPAAVQASVKSGLRDLLRENG